LRRDIQDDAGFHATLSLMWARHKTIVNVPREVKVVIFPPVDQVSATIREFDDALTDVS
jgi:hypothetical protein